jgi:hypothetical protein
MACPPSILGRPRSTNRDAIRELRNGQSIPERHYDMSHAAQGECRRGHIRLAAAPIPYVVDKVYAAASHTTTERISRARPITSARLSGRCLAIGDIIV